LPSRCLRAGSPRRRVRLDWAPYGHEAGQPLAFWRPTRDAQCYTPSRLSAPSSFAKPTARPHSRRPEPPLGLNQKAGRRTAAGMVHDRAPPAQAQSKAVALAHKAAPAPSAGYEGAGTLRAGPGEGGNPHARSAVQKPGRRLCQKAAHSFGPHVKWPAPRSRPASAGVPNR
jgi:hypothetical protein